MKKKITSSHLLNILTLKIKMTQIKLELQTIALGRESSKFQATENLTE